MEIFQNRLRELRGSRRQADIANDLGISMQSYSAFENGREPSYDILLKIANLYDVSIDYLLGRTDHKHLENVSIGERTGLNDMSIAEIEKLKTNDDMNAILNHFIGNELFHVLIENIFMYVGCSLSEEFRSGAIESFNEIIKLNDEITKGSIHFSDDQEIQKYMDRASKYTANHINSIYSRYFKALQSREGTEALLLSEISRSFDRIISDIKTTAHLYINFDYYQPGT